VNSQSKPPFRHVDFKEPKVETERRKDGTIVLRSGYALGGVERNICVYLRRWGRDAPERVYLKQRDAKGEWRDLTFGRLLAEANAVGQALLARGLGPDRPVMILSGNSLEQAVLTYGAMTVGVTVVPVSPAYSIMSQDFAKLKYIHDLIKPAMVFVQSGRMYGAALKALALAGVEIVHVDAPPEGMPSTAFADLVATTPTPAVDAAFAKVGPETVAKILFTSGSTGMPKGVINTQLMLTSNQAMAEALAAPEPDDPPVVLDWLPWHHTFGGNFNIHSVLRHGGTMYIDTGRPILAMFDQTIRNLRDLSPTSFSNVPVGYAMLAPVLEKDAALRETFFRKLKLMSYGGASLPRELWDRMQALAIAATGERIMFVTGWGSTETAPTATTLHWPIEGTGVIGLPYPGVEIKMVPNGSKYELRVRGPIVTPGYFKRDDLTKAAFDEEGFYKIGDAGRLVDPADPAKGLAFEGRVVEDFKLDTGTWVGVGALRLKALDAAAPALQDAVVTGHDKPFIGLLAWPNLAACIGLCRDPANAKSPKTIVKDAGVIEHVRKGLAAHNARIAGTSERIKRVILMAEPASLDAGELTDKGYINQRATLERRTALVDALYAEPPGEGVIVIG
jgi:feruloyl-CoA synthase